MVFILAKISLCMFQGKLELSGVWFYFWRPTCQILEPQAVTCIFPITDFFWVCTEIAAYYVF